ncbi:LysR family transcriptional regulator [Cytobacillus purgationiresistens]|uniref:DNA-binding transcriptional LysR family regulator n=1 Tax=Cytobacillus purgationiresistens TaxID=863449 RepID=A0ABU0ANJ2_9BACI|nr:LysR family transcriptional regulator [Cytobacillus purgationiresistens]MDQ0272846.1 DNA-binding transcriptional LysR family regulator [Cytobacillus purgationiresistens]
MDIRQLRYFVTIAEEKSYSKAAKSLHISQPSLSNAIMKLEAETKFQLLERNTKGLALTEAGQIFHMRSTELLRKFDNMLKELEEIREVGNGTISIGLIESSKFWLFKVIKDFKKTFPTIHFQLKEILGHQNVIESLINCDVHFTITNQPVNNEEINLIPIYSEKFVLLVNNHDPISQQEKIALNEILTRDLILSTSGFQTRKDILDAFEQEGVKPNIYFEIERLETACSIVEEGLGVTILPESYVRYAFSPHTTSIPIDSSFLSRTVYLAHLKDRYLPPAVHQLFADIHQFINYKNE